MSEPLQVTRYRQRLPEVDALLVTSATVARAIEWLSSWGRDGYAVSAELHVLPGRGAQGFDVPFGHHLIRDVGTGAWAPVAPGGLVAEYARVEPLVGPIHVHHINGTEIGPIARRPPLGQPGGRL